MSAGLHKNFASLTLLWFLSACADVPPQETTPVDTAKGTTPLSSEIKTSQQPGGALMSVEWVMAPSSTPTFNPNVVMRLTPNKYFVGICNFFNGSSRFDGNHLVFYSGVTTQKGCPEEIQKWSNAFFKVMESGVQIEQRQNTLTLTDLHNKSVVYQFKSRFIPAPSAEKQFIELDRELTPCEQNSQKKCFKIRILNLNEQSIEVGQGNWQTQEKIFGYDQSEHSGSVKMRVLIDRQSTPPVGFSSPIWYNDMVYSWSK